NPSRNFTWTNDPSRHLSISLNPYLFVRGKTQRKNRALPRRGARPRQAPPPFAFTPSVVANELPYQEEIRKRFEEDPSLISEEAHDKDLYSTLFPKERSGRRHGLGLLVGGVASAHVFEAFADVQEVRHENKKLWSVVEKLMSNQTKLQQQYDELKSQVSAPQRCPSVESSPKIDVSPEGYQKVTNKENKDDSVSSPKQEEPKSVVLPTLKSTKSRMSKQQKEKDKERAQTLPEKDKKQRKFQTPLHIATKDMEEDIKCGMEVGLTSPNSKMMVALGTVQTTDRKAKASDG
ncbi:hypothetical protein EJB05_12426, partial [Eragrostis curvula]